MVFSSFHKVFTGLSGFHGVFTGFSRGVRGVFAGFSRGFRTVPQGFGVFHGYHVGFGVDDSQKSHCHMICRKT